MKNLSITSPKKSPTKSPTKQLEANQNFPHTPTSKSQSPKSSFLSTEKGSTGLFQSSSSRPLQDEATSPRTSLSQKETSALKENDLSPTQGKLRSDSPRTPLNNTNIHNTGAYRAEHQKLTIQYCGLRNARNEIHQDHLKRLRKTPEKNTEEHEVHSLIHDSIKEFEASVDNSIKMFEIQSTGDLEQDKKTLYETEKQHVNSANNLDHMRNVTRKLHSTKVPLLCTVQYLHPQEGAEEYKMMSVTQKQLNKIDKVLESIGSNEYLQPNIELVDPEELYGYNQTKIDQKMETGFAELNKFLAAKHNCRLKESTIAKYDMESLIKDYKLIKNFKIDLFLSIDKKILDKFENFFPFLRLPNAIKLCATDTLTENQLKGISSGDLTTIENNNTPAFITSFSSGAINNLQEFTELAQSKKFNDNFIIIATLTDINSPSHSINNNAGEKISENENKFLPTFLYKLYKSVPSVKAALNEMIPELTKISGIERIDDENLTQKQINSLQDNIASLCPMQLGLVAIPRYMLEPLKVNNTI